MTGMSSRRARSARLALALVGALALTSCDRETGTPPPAMPAGVPIVIYSSLPEERMRAIGDAWMQASGVPVHYLLDTDAALIDKLAGRAHRPPADLLLVSGIGNLALATEEDVLRPTASESLSGSIPAGLRDPEGYWFGLTMWADVIAYDRRLVQAADLTGYADLGNERWRGRLCALSGTSDRTRTRVASMIESLGLRDAELAVRGWRGNLAVAPFATESGLLAAIEDGSCQVAVVGSDAIAAHTGDGFATNIGLHWPSASDGGAQRDLLGAGVTRHAGNPTQAVALLAWLASEEGQRVLTGAGRDFPVSPGVAPKPPADRWLGFAISPVEPGRLAYLREDADRLMERARFR